MKLFKKYYVVILLILCLSSGIIYGSYALYTTGADFSNAVNVGTDITYKFDINNTESIGVSNNSNFRFKGSLTNTIGSTMNYKFYYKVEGASSGVTVKEVTDGAMKSSGSINNGATVTPEFYITNTSGSNITVIVGVSFAYSGTTVVQESGTNWITSTIAGSEAKTGNCTTEGISIGEIANLSPSLKKIYDLGLESKLKSAVPDFSSVATTDEGIYATSDDYGISYYFRGAVTNNYIKFAGYYWRIIRINGDGTIRIIYDGTSAHANGGLEFGEDGADRQLSIKSAFNPSHNSNAYVGFMYGDTGADRYYATHANTHDSTIKVALDNWYNGLSSENKGYIADRVFCGDRSLDGGTGVGTDSTSTWYGAINRLSNNKNPQLICPNKEDKYTVDDTTIGNGALTNPIGLISADEVAMAGAVLNKDNKLYYLYTGYYYATMTAAMWSGPDWAYIFFQTSSGELFYTLDLTNALNPRPVVNLKSDITFSGGNGSKDTPWVVGTGN